MAVIFTGRRPEKNPLPPVPPLLATHAAKWRGCELCDLHLIRSRVVLYRGEAPCDLLFIGEGPGESEDAFGEPFTGIAGRMLNTLLEDLPQEHPDLRVGISNIVACFPHTTDDVGKRTIIPPNAKQCRACMPRLKELIDLVQPRMIVALGVPANKYMRVMKIHEQYPFLALAHPSSILRKPDTEKPIEIKRFLQSLYTFLETWN